MPSPLKNNSPSRALALTYRIVEDCMIASCNGESDCATCINTIYEPIFSQLEDSECTGLVIDKRGITCSREKKSLNLVVDTILRYKNRSPLRKMALVTSIAYTKDEEKLRDILFSKGLNIRLYSDLEEAIAWACAYP
ncbi:MAG: hypothetical protein C0622_11305 [Desulfuromonas sp.]|nr:MAG: hypothetical protein C0622_11305 [Desulfuromonas sp.]